MHPVMLVVNSFQLDPKSESLQTLLFLLEQII